MRALYIIAAALSIISCAAPNKAEQLDSFVENAEANSQAYTADDWAQSEADFQALLSEYRSSGDEYTPEEREMAAQAVGRYHALLLKEGIRKTGDYIRALGKILPDYLEGFATELGKGAEELGRSLESMIDTAAVESSLEKLGAALDRIFNSVGEN